MTYLLGIDLGTTNIKCVVFDSECGQIVATASLPTPVTHPRPDWSEHDPNLLWQTTAACLRQVCSPSYPISALAISSMAEPGIPVDAHRNPLTNMIAWHDRRSEKQAAWIEQIVPIAEQFAITGQRVSPSFVITKILWLRENQPDVYQRMTTWLPAPAYLLERLCGHAAIDTTLAARTLLFDQQRLDWSDRLLTAFDLDRHILPAVLPAGSFVGYVSDEAARITGLPVGSACLVGGHDHFCAAFATGAIAPGSVVDSSGTAQAVLMLLPKFLTDPQLAVSGYACSAYLLPGLFALKGGLKAAGSSIEWLARQFTDSHQPPDYANLERAAWENVGKRAGPIWLPHMIGSGTPEGDRFSQAAVVGVRFEHDRGDLFRGLLESLAFWLRHNLETMQHYSGGPSDFVTLTGGITRLDLLSQLKADVLGIPMRLPQIPESAAVGAALLAGMGSGTFRSPAEACSALRYPTTLITPDAVRVAWYDRLYQQVYRPLYATLRETNIHLASFPTKSTEETIQ